LTATAEQQLDAIQDHRTRQTVVRVIDRLEHHPEQQGKHLRGAFAGYRRVRAAGQQYRVSFTVHEEDVVVVVVCLGRRNEGSKVDAYELALRVVRLGFVGRL